MQVIVKSSGRNRSNNLRNRAVPGCRIESLEGRRLFAFSTVDAVPDRGNELGMAADGLGNVYVAGYSNLGTATAGWDYTLRQGSNGGTTWEDILTLPRVWNGSAWNEMAGIAASPIGDVYVSYGSGILERPAGDNDFHPVDIGLARITADHCMTVDAAGKAYAIGSVPVTGAEGKTTTQYRAAVLRQVDTLGAFSTVDTFAGGYLLDVCATTQAVYAVGVRQVANGKTTILHWLVRKSPTGDPGTWATVDDFQYDAANNMSSTAGHVTVDASGKVFVGGRGSKQIRTGGTDRRPIYTTADYSLVRTSADGGASWTTEQVPKTGGVGINAIGADAAGNVYVAGAQQGSGGTLLQMKPAGGGSWVTVDHIDSADYAKAYGITTDSNGNVYFAGFEDDNAGYSYGFVRMMPAAAPAGTFSSASITDSSTVDPDRIVEDIFGA